MNTYHLALFVHLCALLAAIGASAVNALAMRRIRSAETAGDALTWLRLCKDVARVFPVALLLLLATGAYMVHRLWTWDTGWVDAGLVGVVLLGLLGDRVEGVAGKRLAGRLAADPARRLEHEPALVRDPVWWTAALANPALALGIVFVMVMKPSLAGGLATLAIAIAVGALVAVRFWSTAPSARSPRARVARPARPEGR